MNLEVRESSDSGKPDKTEYESIRQPPLFAENMLTIGRIVSACGIQHPGFPLNMIQKLDSSSDETKGFEAVVYLEPADDPYIELNKHGAPIPGILGYKCNHLEITYRPDGKTSLRIQDISEYPESASFERPKFPLPPSSIFVDHGDSLFIWMQAEFLGPNIVRFLDTVTTEGLAELQRQ